MHATFNLHDNKLKLFLDPANRLPEEEFRAIRAMGMAWWRGSKCFAGVWTPEREALVKKYAGEIDFLVDDDCGFEYRLERFNRYEENASARAERWSRRIEDLIEHGPPMGQPIMIGHHSERMARKHQKDLDTSMRHLVQEKDLSDYWEMRQEAARRHAAYKERPDVILRRIQGYERDLRRYQAELTSEGKAKVVDSLYFHASLAGEKYQNIYAFIEANQEKIETAWQKHLDYQNRWIDHLEMLIEYQRELYERSGKVAFDRGGVTLEVGGAIKCLFSNAHWVPILKVNPKTVTFPDTYHWGELGQAHAHAFTRTIPKVEITKALTKAEYEAHPHYATGQLLIAALKQTNQPPANLTIERGGAIKYRFPTWVSGKTSEWVEVLRVNPNTISYRRFNQPSGRFSDHKIEKSYVVQSMSKSDWEKEKANNVALRQPA